ncbi:hypothetical protein LV164_003921 [Aspergillus fumigatus]|nr:hypothetical protein KXX57_002618 [Aspergillus fumigatus]KAH1981008.1 hypothetical protein KXW88_006304 [Aspergillus fumigatus]KAH2311699.1 hypothetical protein KXV47_004434 [Aspergillus fumigatus]KAH2661538.1 hypothetical protein KXV32_000486 [Aspergillus fumigatus]KAH2756345.1 hypothetical protein KXV94_009299 [Aspergillus fumigatus]
MASPHAQTVINTIVRQIPTITAFTEIVYEDVAPEDGDLMTRSLAESAVVEQHSARINFNSLTKTLWVRVFPTELHDVQQRWMRFTSSEWRASGLLNTAEDELLDLGVGTINAVVLLKWSKTSNDRVKGTAEVWRRGVGGCGLTAHTKIIFPAPNPAPAPGTDIIEFSRQDLFGHHMRPGRSLTDVFPLDLEDLRDFARERLMVLMGLTPA